MIYISSTGTQGGTVCLAPQLFLPVYLHANVRPPSLPAATLPALVLQPPSCCMSSPPWLPVSVSPTSLHECFFSCWTSIQFDFLAVLVIFLFLNLLLSFFWLCEEAKCINLCLDLGWKSEFFCIHPDYRINNFICIRPAMSRITCYICLIIDGNNLGN